MNLSLNRVLCAIATLLFVLAAVGGGLGLAVSARETVGFWGLAFFAAGHVV